MRPGFVLALLGAVLAGCASVDERSKLKAVPEFRPGILMGYLNPQELPNSLALLPPYPTKIKYLQQQGRHPF